ncbi:hypothetical protein L1987_19262 [Smallanthus sonchifolius]|uniref:Uncharacterized protein n=1 Tax=Smallanthus sonchifolius TaxID=185202 RepID=A0ACB9IQA7_9ASTR|nr:hypothetical protein L1987_19262 [Smallanthus sonchifolius]
MMATNLVHGVNHYHRHQISRRQCFNFHHGRTSMNVNTFSHIFDTSVGMTGVAELAEVDGPFVKIRLKGRFWHERSLVLARLGNYLKERISEILEVDIEDEKQLDDSPENF